MAVMTGLSGNEIYCLHLKGVRPGDLVIGNSVFSVGFLGSLGAGLQNLIGGEVTPITSAIHEGRQKSLMRMLEEAQRRGGIGVTGVTSQIIQHDNTVEFLSIGSCVHTEASGEERFAFSTSSNGQELYCQLDAGFRPIQFVFGNVAYSIGVGGGLLGGLRSLGRGEVTEYSEVFNTTRHLALQRIVADARSHGANSVIGIRTSIVPFKGMQEMVMLGTASHHPSLPAAYTIDPITSDLTNEEMWNLINVGYMPIKLVLGVSVYSLGLMGGITSSLKRFRRGEIDELSSLIYEARERAIGQIAEDARACGADDVAGVKTYVYALGGGLIEFMAIGTAVKRMPGFATASASLPGQAVMDDKDTFVNTADRTFGVEVSASGGRRNGKRSIGKDKGPVTWWDVAKFAMKLFFR